MLLTVSSKIIPKHADNIINEKEACFLTFKNPNILSRAAAVPFSFLLLLLPMDPKFCH